MTDKDKTAVDPDLENQELGTDENLEQIETASDAEQEMAELKDKYLRLVAEFENFRKRTARERAELFKTASEGTIKKFLPIMDDFNRAKGMAEDENSDEIFSEGVTLVYDKLHSTMKGLGVSEMQIEDGVFDGEFHEAITEIPVPDEDKKGKIVDVVEKGYLLHDKIIRYAKVVVGR